MVLQPQGTASERLRTRSPGPPASRGCRARCPPRRTPGRAARQRPPARTSAASRRPTPRGSSVSRAAPRAACRRRTCSPAGRPSRRCSARASGSRESGATPASAAARSTWTLRGQVQGLLQRSLGGGRGPAAAGAAAATAAGRTDDPRGVHGVALVVPAAAEVAGAVALRAAHALLPAAAPAGLLPPGQGCRLPPGRKGSIQLPARSTRATQLAAVARAHALCSTRQSGAEGMRRLPALARRGLSSGAAARHRAFATACRQRASFVQPGVEPDTSAWKPAQLRRHAKRSRAGAVAARLKRGSRSAASEVWESPVLLQAD